jgi:serine acetyltransferase
MSVVLHDVPPGATAVGVPARLVESFPPAIATTMVAS